MQRNTGVESDVGLLGARPRPWGLELGAGLAVGTRRERAEGGLDGRGRDKRHEILLEIIGDRPGRVVFICLFLSLCWVQLKFHDCEATSSSSTIDLPSSENQCTVQRPVHDWQSVFVCISDNL